MKTYFERTLHLPIIKSKADAFNFLSKVDKDDLVHTFGIDINNKSIGNLKGELWNYRKNINAITRQIRKEVKND